MSGNDNYQSEFYDFAIDAKKTFWKLNLSLKHAINLVLCYGQFIFSKFTVGCVYVLLYVNDSLFLLPLYLYITSSIFQLYKNIGIRFAR